MGSVRNKVQQQLLLGGSRRTRNDLISNAFVLEQVEMSCDTISSCTAVLCQQLAECINDARSKFCQQPSTWLDSQLTASLAPSIGLYCQYFNALNVSTHAQLEQLFQANFNSDIVRTAYDQLAEVEDDWNKLIDEVDFHLRGGKPRVEPGQSVPHTLKVLDLKGNSKGLMDLFTAETKMLHIILLRHFA